MEVDTKELEKRYKLHKERHTTDFKLPEIILGGQDGLVNVLGVILGVAVATASNNIVIIAGLAAAFAESVSMGAVAYTSRIAEADHYQSEYEMEEYEVEHYPEEERAEVKEIYRKYGFEGKMLDHIVTTLTRDKKLWVQVMMEQELKLEPVDRKGALMYGLIVGLSAIVGSFIPLTAFFFLPVGSAMVIAIAISTATLFAVGVYKAKKTLGRSFIKQGMEMAVIGMCSAFVGYLIGLIFKV